MMQVELKPVYMYVLVREDLLPVSQVAVQAAHACIEAIRAFAPGQDQEHPHLVLLGVKSEKELLDIYTSLQSQGVRVAAFQEADRNNETTAIATEPIACDSDQRRLFRGYRLLKIKGEVA